MFIPQVVRSTAIDHLGIIKALIDEMQILTTIDSLIGSSKRKVSVGTAVAAMIMNGLGLTGRALYLTPQFFERLPTDLLLGEGITPKNLNDDSLGTALDALYEFGVTEIFYLVASKACSIAGIEHKYLHVDSTSFSLYGKYQDEEDEPKATEVNTNHLVTTTKNKKKNKNLPEVVKINRGHSKDGKPELNQVMLNLITTNRSSIPVWIEVLSGNTSDKKSFHKTIASFKNQIKDEEMPVFVADSAFYTSEGIKSLNGVSWITRVPELIKEAKMSIDNTDPATMKEIIPGYKVSAIESSWSDVKQRWLVVFSAKREMHTFERRLKKETEAQEKACKHLAGREFSCLDDAEKEVKLFIKSLKLHNIEYQIVEQKHYANKGRPMDNAIPDRISYHIAATLQNDEGLIAKATARKGFFIIATNVLDSMKLSDEELLSVYKSQGVSVERGFRFLKDPMFYAESMFLNSPKRIMALIMVMTLSLLVYSLAERKVRKSLKDMNLTIKSQVKKPTNNPTLRWVFQIFFYTPIITVELEDGTHMTHAQLNEDQRIILKALGPNYEKCYFLV
jgi:transposase